jgi:hypothetical protein
VLITRDEWGRFRLASRTPAQRPVNRAIRAHISQGFVTLIREERPATALAAGRRQRWTFGVTAEDAAYGSSLILVRVSTLRQAPMPSQSRACGIVVLGIPWVSGSAGDGRLAGVGLVGPGGRRVAVGAGQPTAGGPPAPRAYAMIAISVVTLAVLAVGLAGAWVLGVLLLALWVLLLIAVASQAILDS